MYLYVYNHRNRNKIAFKITTEACLDVILVIFKNILLFVYFENKSEAYKNFRCLSIYFYWVKIKPRPRYTDHFFEFGGIFRKETEKLHINGKKYSFCSLGET